MSDAITKLKQGQNLSFEESKSLFSNLMEGKHEESQIIEILEALIKKGETKDELAGGIFVLRDKATKVSSLVAITGFVNVPIIKFSVDWWASLHQPSSVKILSETTIHSSMLTPLLLMTAAFALFSVLIFLMKYNIELIKIKTKGLDRL